MSVAHLIARLSAGTTNFRAVGRGGLPALTTADIAQAVGRISNPAAQLLVLMKYAGQDSPAVTGEVVQLLIDEVMACWVVPERWGCRMRKGDNQTGRQRLEAHIELMVLSVVDEVVNPRHCKECKGLGHVHKRRADGLGLEPELCGRAGCVGGRVKYSESARARRCGIGMSTFRCGAWSGRYERMLRRVNGLIAQGLDEVEWALG